MQLKESANSPRSYAHPKYWSIWCGLFLFRALLYLPLKVQFALGGSLGVLGYSLAKSRRAITKTNLRIAYPEASETALRLLTKDVFRQAGISLFETLLVWFRPHVFEGRINYVGLEAVKDTLKQRGILLIGAHYSAIELGAASGKLFGDAGAVYRPQNNPLFEHIIHSGRSDYMRVQIPAKSASKAATQALRDRFLIWYTPDQDFGLKHGLMAEFFGHPAATVSATGSLVNAGRAALLFGHICRTKNPGWFSKPEYQLTFVAPASPFPSESISADTQLINDHMEALIRLAPTQYMWFHKRFKTQPDGINPYGGRKKR